MTLVPDREIINQGHEEFRELLKEHLDSRPGVNALLATVGHRFFTAPASSKADWHACYDGGLAYHTLHVAKLMIELREVLPGAKEVPIDSCVLVALIHDLGKIGNAEHPYYSPQENQWRRDNLGEFYKVNWDLTPLSVPQRALWWCQAYNVSLTEEEFQAMIAHESDEKRFMFSQNPLLYLLKFADQWSALVQSI